MAVINVQISVKQRKYCDLTCTLALCSTCSFVVHRLGEIDSRKHHRKHKMNTSQQLPTIADFALCLAKPASYTNIYVFFLSLLLKRNLSRSTRSNGRNIAAELLNCGSSFLRPY